MAKDDELAKMLAGKDPSGNPKIVAVDADGKILISLASDAVAAAIKAKTDNLPASPADKNTVISFMDFWSDIQQGMSIASLTPVDIEMPTVTVALPSGVTVVAVYAMFKFRAIKNTEALENMLQADQYIQVRADTPGTWRNALLLPESGLTVQAETTEGGDALIGNLNLVAEVVGNDIYEFQWHNQQVNQAAVEGMMLWDVQVGLRIYFK